jgi:hypothetical protein
MKETFMQSAPAYQILFSPAGLYLTPAILPIIPASVKAYLEPGNAGHIVRAVLKSEPPVRLPIGGDDAC